MTSIKKQPDNKHVNVSTPKEPTNGVQESFDEWALLELFGHQKICGRVTAGAIGGASFVRVDVPETGGGRQGYTRYYSPSSIYSIQPVTKETAMAMIQSGINPEMISRYDVKRLLPMLAESHPANPDLSEEPYEDG